MASQNRAALESGRLPLEAPKANDGLAERVRQAYERKLREPLATAASITSVLKQQVDEELAREVGRIEEATERTSRMLGEFVEFVQNEIGGGIRVARRRLDLRLVCERAVDAIQRGHPFHAIEFVRAPRVEGMWDPDRIEALLSRLVVNAIEHGSHARGVRVRLEATTDQAVLEVWNAGPVIDEVLMRRLFEPFVCGPSSRAEGPRGMGLGLYLARAIARAHGGRIEVQSDARDGTAFRVFLPRA
jgi:signal transduction histidine kinase